MTTYAQYIRAIAVALDAAFPGVPLADIPEPDRSHVELAVIRRITTAELAEQGREMHALAQLATFEPEVSR